MAGISDTLKKIPSKARLMLVFVSITAVGASYGFYNMMHKNNPELPVNGATGAIGVSLNPDKTKIDKARPDQEDIIPKESPVAQEIKNIKNNEVEEAKKSGGSFVDALRLRNETRVVNKIDQELNQKPVTTGIDDINQARRDAENKRKDDLLKRRNELTSQQQAQDIQTQKNTRYAFNEDEFLQKEIDSNKYKSEGMMGYTKDNVANDKKRTSEYHNATVQNGSSNTTNNAANASGYASSLPSSNTALTANDQKNLNRLRALSGTDKSTASTASAYNSLVNPTGVDEKILAPYITSGTMYYAILEIGVNTDEISPVRATIVQEGPLKNAVLVGQPARIGEKAVIQFTSMSINGKDYAVNVVALDPDTMRTGLADDVDNHTFERYFKLATASVVSGYSEALTGTTTRTYSDGSKESVTAALPKTSDAIAAAIGKVGTTLAPKFEKEFDRPPTITVNGSHDLGIMFMKGIQL